MSALPPIPPPDDPLERATDALRRAPVPDGPSDDTLARALAALHAAEAPTLPFFTRRRTMMLFVKAAATIAAAAGLFYTAGSWLSSPTVAFAEVAGKLRDAHTLACKMTMQVTGQKEAVTARMLFKEPWHVRTETATGQVSVGELNRGKILTWDPATKQALLMEITLPADGKAKPKGDAGSTQLLEQLRNLAEKKGEPAGQKQIGTVQAQGFRVKEGDVEMLIWADPKTKAPLLVEETMHTGNVEVRYTLSDFEIDPPLDDALFRMEAPAGYQLRTLKIDQKSPEVHVADLLRLYAEKSGGAFPKQLDDWLGYAKAIQGEKKPEAGVPDDRSAKIMQDIIQVSMFLQTHKDRYGYKADGVKLGEADKIIFWYKPEGSDKYRALFGDLHAADVTADRLPEKPKS